MFFVHAGPGGHADGRVGAYIQEPQASVAQRVAGRPQVSFGRGTEWQLRLEQPVGCITGPCAGWRGAGNVEAWMGRRGEHANVFVSCCLFRAGPPSSQRHPSRPYATASACPALGRAGIRVGDLGVWGSGSGRGSLKQMREGGHCACAGGQGGAGELGGSSVRCAPCRAVKWAGVCVLNSPWCPT